MWFYFTQIVNVFLALAMENMHWLHFKRAVHLLGLRTTLWTTETVFIDLDLLEGLTRQMFGFAVASSCYGEIQVRLHVGLPYFVISELVEGEAIGVGL